MNLKFFKSVYDKLGNDTIRSNVLQVSELIGMRKNVVRLDTNNFCNIECIFCSNKRGGGSKHILPFQDFTKIIDRLASKTRFIYLSCGYEPLLTPKFEEYLLYTKKAGIPFISLCTNALLLRDNIIKTLVDEQIDEIIVSFNGFNPTDYNRIMNYSDYEKVIKALIALKQYKEEKNSVYPKVRLNTIFMRSNIENIPALEKFINDYNIDFINFRELLVSDSANNKELLKEESLDNFTDAQKQQLQNDLQSLVQRLENKSIMIPNILLEQHQLTAKKDMSTHKNSCSIPFFSYWVESNGLIKSCLFHEQSKLGNLLTDDWSVIQKRAKNFRKLAIKGECSMDACNVSNIDSSTII